MKRVRFFLLLLLCIFTLNCSGNKYTVEGKLIDWNDKPVAGVTIIAMDMQVKGTMPLEWVMNTKDCFRTVTNDDGSFRISGLSKKVKYIVKPVSDKWICETTEILDSVPQSKILVLPNPMKISNAFSYRDSFLLSDLDTGSTRFTIGDYKVITDSMTKLEWTVGPDRNVSWNDAEQWVKKCNIAGGNWRMPTEEEINGIYFYRRHIDEPVLDSAFQRFMSGCLWAKPYSSSMGQADRSTKVFERCVFGVRSHSRD